MRPEFLLQKYWRGWRVAMNLIFGLLSVRFIYSIFETAAPYPTGIITISFVGLLMGCVFPFPALFSFIAMLPLLAGLEQTSLLQVPAFSAFVFSVIWCGWRFGTLFRGMAKMPSPPMERRAAFPNPSISVLPAVPLAVELIATAIIVSLLFQLWRHGNSFEFWNRFWKQPVFGYGDPLYFLTASFLWLQGLFFFLLLLKAETKALSADYKNGSPSTSPAPLGNSLYDAGPTRGWIAPVFITFAATIIVFLGIQYFYHFPEGWTLAGYFSPYEDISSFGSIAASVFIFGVATFHYRSGLTALFCVVYGVASFIAVIASWSRAAWLAAGVMLLISVWIRLSRKLSVVTLALIVGAVTFINLNANHERWRDNTYFSRLVSLVRFENPANKDAGRINLYYKAIGMIKERPLTGHLIGSFYVDSTRFGRASDPFAGRPDFAHNIFLQLAAELGLPIALLFAATCGYTVYRGFAKYVELPTPSFARESAGIFKGFIPLLGKQADRFLLLGATLALTTYLMTQMTANSLNVYISNQFFFWFLVAAILTFPCVRDNVLRKTG
jgi:O-antigen ligase